MLINKIVNEAMSRKGKRNTHKLTNSEQNIPRDDHSTLCIAKQNKSSTILTFEELNQVLDRLKSHNLRLNKEKCHFSKSEVMLYGHIFGAEGLRSDQRKVEALQPHLRVI